jgi:UDP-glucose 4-epimerase
MRIAITGGTGLVGRFIVEDCLARGQDVTVLGRTPPRPGFFSAPVRFLPFDLGGDPPALEGHDRLVHAAFDHLPGLYRGGEGGDPDGFLRRNVGGTLALFAMAERAGIDRGVFISTRAVYGDYPEGTPLDESLTPRPDTLYGRAKLLVEEALTGRATNLRVTGVYGPPGPGQQHKWADLFDDFAKGRPIAPRIATEVHGVDLARAVRIVLELDAPPVLNVSDLLLDRHDLLAEVARLTGSARPLPPRSAAAVSVMRTDRLRALGWIPSGVEGLRDALTQMIPA